MSWDDKDFYSITFHGKDVEAVKQASKEYDDEERKYNDKYEWISINRSGWNLEPLSTNELKRLQIVANKYSITISYTFNGKYIRFTPGSDHFSNNSKYIINI